MLAGLQDRVDEWLDAVYRDERTIASIDVNGEVAVVSSIGQDGENVTDEVRLTVEERDAVEAVFDEWDELWEEVETPVEGCTPAGETSFGYDGSNWTIRKPMRSYRPAPSSDSSIATRLEETVSDDVVRYTVSVVDGEHEHTVDVDTVNPHQYHPSYETREEFVASRPSFLFEDLDEQKSFNLSHTPEFDDSTGRFVEDWVDSVFDEMVCVQSRSEDVVVSPTRLNVGFGITTKCTFVIEWTLE